MFLGKFSFIWIIVFCDIWFWELNIMGIVSSIENGFIIEIICRVKFVCRLLVFILEGIRVVGFLIDIFRGIIMFRCVNIFCRLLCFLFIWIEEFRIVFFRWFFKIFGIIIMFR